MDRRAHNATLTTSDDLEIAPTDGCRSGVKEDKDDRSCTPHRNGAPDLRRVGVALGAMTLAVALLVTVAVVRPAGARPPR